MGLLNPASESKGPGDLRKKDRLCFVHFSSKLKHYKIQLAHMFFPRERLFVTASSRPYPRITEELAQQEDRHFSSTTGLKEESLPFTVDGFANQSALPPHCHCPPHSTASCGTAVPRGPLCPGHAYGRGTTAQVCPGRVWPMAQLITCRLV